MNTVLRIGVLAAALAAALPAAADSVHLRDGRVLRGEFLGATARSVHLRAAEGIRRLRLAEIERVELDPRPEAPPAAAAVPSAGDGRVVIVGTGPRQAIEREPAATR